MNNSYPNLQKNNQTVVIGSLFFRHLRTTLYIGSTVLIKGHLNNDVETSVFRAGRIIAFNYTYDNEYLVDILLYVPFASSVVSKFENLITDFPLKDMIELVMTNEVISVYESSIYDVSFIFSVDDVLSGHALCHGIINSFVSRFQLEYDNNYYSSIIQDDISLVFPSLASSFAFGDSCYHQRIFNGITKIQDKMCNLLNRGTQKQMEYHLHKEYLTINEELWVYITTRCDKLTKPIITQGKNRIKRLAILRRSKARFSCQAIAPTSPKASISTLVLIARASFNWRYHSSNALFVLPCCNSCIAVRAS